MDVKQEGDAWRVTVDGRAWLASMVRAGDRWSLLLRDSASETLEAARSYDVVFEPGDAGAGRVLVGGVAVSAGLRSAARRTGRHGGSGVADGRVVAPMPGRVVRVLVAPGAVVEARQSIVVVEAMKMENELKAPKAGVVREVRVTEGASVEAQAVLVVIE
jgi:biotin carboxyl carrier protein